MTTPTPAPTTGGLNPAQERLLARQSPLTDLLKAYRAGTATWEQTRDELVNLEWATVPKLTIEEQMGQDGGQARASREPGMEIVAGSWPEFVLAGDLGIVTREEVNEVLGILAAKGTAEPQA